MSYESSGSGIENLKTALTGPANYAYIRFPNSNQFILCVYLTPDAGSVMKAKMAVHKSSISELFNVDLLFFFSSFLLFFFSSFLLFFFNWFRFWLFFNWLNFWFFFNWFRFWLFFVLLFGFTLLLVLRSLLEKQKKKKKKWQMKKGCTWIWRNKKCCVIRIIRKWD